MALETQRRDIRGLEIVTTQLPARRAYALLPKLGAIIGPALGELDGINLEKLGDDVAAIAPAFTRFFGALNDTDADALMVKIFERTQVVKDDKLIDLSNPANIDRAFEGALKAMLEAMWFVLQVNFADFFDGDSLQNALSAAGQKAAASE